MDKADKLIQEYERSIEKMYLLNYGNKLKAFRKRHSLSQKQAAELLGYGIESWRSYEQGKRKTPLHLLKHIDMYNDHSSCFTCEVVFDLPED